MEPFYLSCVLAVIVGAAGRVFYVRQIDKVSREAFYRGVQEGKASAPRVCEACKEVMTQQLQFTTMGMHMM